MGKESETEIGKEPMIIKDVVHLIKSAGQSLGLYNVTITRALIINHHFKRCVGSVEYDDGLTAAAALCLSAKVNEDDIDETSIIDYFWRIFKNEEPYTNSPEFQELSESVTLMEYFICRMLKFSFQYKLAHEFLVPFLRRLHEKEEFQCKWGYFVTAVWRAVTTIYETRRCLDYEASEIAAACISFACLICDIKFLESNNWHQLFSATADREKCLRIITDIITNSNDSHNNI